MRRISNFRIAKESAEDMIAAGRFNPCLEITFADRRGRYTHKIAAGNTDVIHVYRNSKLTFVLSVNDRLGYGGLEVFDGAETPGDVFLQGEQVKETLGKEGLAPFTIIRLLMDLIG